MTNLGERRQKEKILAPPERLRHGGENINQLVVVTTSQAAGAAVMEAAAN